VINRDRHDLAGISVKWNLLPFVIVSLVLFRSAPAQTPTRKLLSRVAVSGLAIESFMNDAVNSRRDIKAIAFDGFPFSIYGLFFTLTQEKHARQMEAYL